MSVSLKRYRVTCGAFDINSTVDVYAKSEVEAAFLVGLNSDLLNVPGHTDLTKLDAVVTANSAIDASVEFTGYGPDVDQPVDALDALIPLIFG